MNFTMLIPPNMNILKGDVDFLTARTFRSLNEMPYMIHNALRAGQIILLTHTQLSKINKEVYEDYLLVFIKMELKTIKQTLEAIDNGQDFRAIAVIKRG